MALPTDVAVGKVVGQFVVPVADGTYPPFKPAQGIIVFTAEIPYVVNPEASPNAYTIVTESHTVIGVLNSQGYVCEQSPSDPTKAGDQGLYLAATNSGKYSNRNWTWTATPYLTPAEGTRHANNITPFTFAVPAAKETDLSTVIKVPASTGAGTEQIIALGAAAARAAIDTAASAAEIKNQALANDAGVAEFLAGGTKTVSALTAATNSVVASPARFSGIDPLGKTSSSYAINLAAAATPDGGTLIIPAGTYIMSSRVYVKGKNIRVMAYGAKFIKTADSPTFDFEGEHESPISVTRWAETTITEDTSGSDPGVQLTLASSPSGWVKGDVVKVYADNVIPGGKPGDGNTDSRVGKFLVVVSAVGSTIKCLGSLDDPFTSNVRVSKLANYSSHFEGGEFSLDTAGMAGAWVNPVIRFRSMAAPSVKNLRIASASGAGIRLVNCYGYVIDNVDVDYAKNSPGDLVYGYGISDMSCQFGQINNYRARRVRHAYTDGTAAQLAGTADPSNYGRSYGTHISNSAAYGTANTAWDTHSWSESITFSDVHAYNCYKAFNLRGKNHRVIDGSGVNCSLGGIFIANETTGGDTYGHYVKDFLSENCGRRSIEANINGTDSVNMGVKEKRKSYINGVTIKGGNANDAIFSLNATLRIDNVVIVPDRSVANDERIVYISNSDIDGSNWTHDTSQMRTQTTGLNLVHMRNESTLKIDGQWNHQATDSSNPIAMAVNVSGSGNKATIPDFRSTHVIGSPTNGLSEDSVFDWEWLNTGQHSGWITGSGTGISTLSEYGVSVQLGRTRRPVVYMRLTANDGPRTLAVLPNGKIRGQELTIWNISTTENITILNGQAGKTNLSPFLDRALAPQERLKLVWQNSVWWQVSERAVVA